MISYTEKGIGLHEAIRAAGHSLRQENGVWISSDDQAVQAIIDAYDPAPPLRAVKIVEVKAEASRRILGVASLERQVNASALQARLLRKGEANWTGAERLAYLAVVALHDRIDALRNASNLIEADIAALADWQEINAFDVAGSVRWPE